MDSFYFWQRWLFWALVLQAVAGIVLAFGGPRVLLGPLNQFYDQTAFGEPSVPHNALTFYRWIYGVLGVTMASWATSLAFVTHFAFKRREQWAWNCVLVSLLIWFPLDTALSLKFGIWPNALFNLVALAMIALPLVFSRSSFISIAKDQGNL